MNLLVRERVTSDALFAFSRNVLELAVALSRSMDGHSFLLGRATLSFACLLGYLLRGLVH
mgnify:CR=1 FL=1